MRLVEVVLLVGSQCVSPVQQTPHVTMASKVPCAVIIHRDTEKNSVAVIPASETDNPKVREALELAKNRARPPMSIGALPVSAKPETGLSSPQSAASSAFGPPAPETLQAASDTTPQTPQTVTAFKQPLQIEPTSSEPDRLIIKRPRAAGGVAAAKAEQDVPAVPDKQSPAPESSATAEATPADIAPVVPKPKPSAATRAASADSGATKTVSHRNDQCRGAAKPQWYTNKAGKRRYRCAVPGKNGMY